MFDALDAAMHRRSCLPVYSVYFFIPACCGKNVTTPVLTQGTSVVMMATGSCAATSRTVETATGMRSRIDSARNPLRAELRSIAGSHKHSKTQNSSFGREFGPLVGEYVCVCVICASVKKFLYPRSKEEKGCVVGSRCRRNSGGERS